jgi:phosphate transport system substrate-binding protein
MATIPANAGAEQIAGDKGVVQMKNARACSFSVIASIAAILVFSIAFPAESQEKTVVRICGAGLLSDVVEAIRKDFVQSHPGCNLIINGATTGIGVRRLIEGEAELGMLSRKVTPEEAQVAEAKGVEIRSTLVGKICLAVVTNLKNPVNELTMDELARIFKGDITNWSAVGGPNEPIKVTIRAVPETGAGVLFQKIVLNGAPYAKNAQIMSSYHTTVQVCGKALGIGYIPTTTMYFDNLSERGVKIIKIKKDINAKPYEVARGVASQTMYPISIDFVLAWNAKLANPCITGFVDMAVKETQ